MSRPRQSIREAAEARGFTEFFIKVWAIGENDEEHEFADYFGVTIEDLERLDAEHE